MSLNERSLEMRRDPDTGEKRPMPRQQDCPKVLVGECCFVCPPGINEILDIDYHNNQFL